MRALFAPAAGPEIGGGHVMRDLALAAALQARGWRCLFAVPPWGARLVERFAGGEPPDLFSLGEPADPAAVAALAARVRPNLIVVDDYASGATAVLGPQTAGRVRMAIDDRAARPVDCDLLLDPGYGRQALDYVGLTPPGCEVLAGPAYALLRRDFARGLSGGETRGEVRRVFVSFGLSDVGEVAARAVERLRPRAPHARFDVALGSDAPSLPRLKALARRDPGLHVHADARDVAGLMRGADAAVGAGGSATWERCALGLPTLAVIVADNQREMTRRLARDGVVLAADLQAPDFGAALDAAFDRLCVPEVRARLAAAARTLCDGRGAERAVDAVERRLSAAGSRGS